MWWKEGIVDLNMTTQWMKKEVTEKKNDDTKWEGKAISLATETEWLRTIGGHGIAQWTVLVGKWFLFLKHYLGVLN